MARYQTGIRTEARIVEATRGLLAEVGLEGTTVKAICERAEVQAGSFYNLFSSKEQVLIQVAREAIQAVGPDAKHAAAETLDELVDAYIAFVVDESALARVYLHVAASSNTDSSVSRRYLRHHVQRVERFANAMRRADPHLTGEDATVQAEVLLGALDGLAFRWLLDDSFEFAKHARIATERYG
jgi:AcrR family transcriptional regulator